ncbi:MAG: hypothetical protein ABGY72_08190 [bacterium]|nr:hypothetical protein [Gemmatimonadota bacterium]
MTDNRSVDAERATSVGRVRGLTAVLMTAVTVGCGVSDEERVRRQLDEIAQTVSIDAGETQMIRQARATRLAMYLAPDVDFDVGAP